MAAGTSMPPTAARIGVAAFDGGCSDPPGAVASTISFAASAKKRVMPTSLTAKCALRANASYEPGARLAHTRATRAPIGSRIELLTMNVAMREEAFTDQNVAGTAVSGRFPRSECRVETVFRVPARPEAPLYC